MVDEQSKSGPPAPGEPAVFGSANAPFVYFDGVGALGVWGGSVQIELAATTVIPVAGGTVKENVVTAHLRTTIAGFAALKDAIQKIEALLAPAEGKPN